MPKGIKNWKTKDVRDFLRCHSFVFYKQLDGSHESWVHIEKDCVVEINITTSNYPERTLETMIRQSGLHKKHWKQWTTLNKKDRKKRKCCSGE